MTSADLLNKLGLTKAYACPNGYIRTNESFTYELPCGYKAESKNFTLVVVDKKATKINNIAI